MLSILAFIFGASIGSFVQVIVSRLHVAPIIKGRSKCLSCGEALRPSDLIPVLSYLFLKGKCRYCKTKYGISAIMIEILFGFSFLLLYNLFLKDQPSLLHSFLYLVYYTALFISLGVMSLYDKAHSYIPSKFLIAFLALCFLMFVKRFPEDLSLVNLLSPIIVALPFLVIFIITKGKGLGFGDVILFLGVGAFFDLYSGLAVLILSVWFGAIIGLYLKYVVYKNKSLNTSIPFVPFIAISFLFVLFTGIDIFSIAMIFT